LRVLLDSRPSAANQALKHPGVAGIVLHVAQYTCPVFRPASASASRPSVGTALHIRSRVSTLRGLVRGRNGTCANHASGPCHRSVRLHASRAPSGWPKSYVGQPAADPAIRSLGSCASARAGSSRITAGGRSLHLSSDHTDALRSRRIRPTCRTAGERTPVCEGLDSKNRCPRLLRWRADLAPLKIHEVHDTSARPTRASLAIAGRPRHLDPVVE